MKNTDKTPLITYQNGTTYEVRSNKQLQEIYNSFLDNQTLFEMAPQTHDQWNDIQPMLLDYHEGKTLPLYDADDFGPGCSVLDREGKQLQGEAACESLREDIEALDKCEIDILFSRRKTYLDAKGRCEAAKAGKCGFVSFKQVWSEAKATMRNQTEALWEIRKMRKVLRGELKARTQESNPTATTWNTSDLDGIADTTELMGIVYHSPGPLWSEYMLRIERANR